MGHVTAGGNSRILLPLYIAVAIVCWVAVPTKWIAGASASLVITSMAWAPTAASAPTPYHIWTRFIHLCHHVAKRKNGSPRCQHLGNRVKRFWSFQDICGCWAPKNSLPFTPAQKHLLESIFKSGKCYRQEGRKIRTWYSPKSLLIADISCCDTSAWITCDWALECSI